MSLLCILGGVIRDRSPRLGHKLAKNDAQSLKTSYKMPHMFLFFQTILLAALPAS